MVVCFCIETTIISLIKSIVYYLLLLATLPLYIGFLDLYQYLLALLHKGDICYLLYF